MMTYRKQVGAYDLLQHQAFVPQTSLLPSDSILKDQTKTG